MFRQKFSFFFATLLVALLGCLSAFCASRGVDAAPISARHERATLALHADKNAMPYGIYLI